MPSASPAQGARPDLPDRLQQLLAVLDQDRARLLERKQALEWQLGAAGLDTPEAIRQAYDGLEASERVALLREFGDPGAGLPDGAPVRRITARRFDRRL